MSQATPEVQSLTVTGVDGFVGRHLARIAKESGFYVRGVSRTANPGSDLTDVLDEYFCEDLTNSFPYDALSDVVIHLAGLAAVGPSFDEPQRYINSNSAMVTNLCESILNTSKNCKVIGVSTGAVYAQPTGTQPIVETDQTVSSSPYAVSKLLVESQLHYYQSRGIPTVIARPFNHVGPGQGPGFIVPDLWDRLVLLQDGTPLPVGNLDTSRDYLDVRDVARAYLALATADTSGIYNVSSGRLHSGREILRFLCEEGDREIPETIGVASMMRPNDALAIVGSSSKLTKDTGWKPGYELRESLRQFIASSDNRSSMTDSYRMN